MLYIYVITNMYDVIRCCYGDIVYHIHWLHFFKKIAGVKKCCKRSDCNIFIANLQKYLNVLKNILFEAK